jgi:hypothetical protein
LRCKVPSDQLQLIQTLPVRHKLGQVPAQA